MKIVFIAGPLSSSEGRAGIEKNIEQAKKFQIALAQRGVFSFCPHVHTFWRGKEGEDISDEFFHSWHVAFMRNCSALIALPGWQESNGTKQDIKEAEDLGIPIFYPDSVNDLDDVAKL